MRKFVFAALAVLGVVLGTASLNASATASHSAPVNVGQVHRDPPSEGPGWG
jgi:hypothetical protein